MLKECPELKKSFRSKNTLCPLSRLMKISPAFIQPVFHVFHSVRVS